MEVLEIVLPVLAMIILGILCRKWKLLDQSGVNNMKTLVTNIMLPVAIFHALATAEYSGKIGILVLIMFVMLLISFGAGFWMKRFMDEPYKKYLPFLICIYEGGMMAYPLYTSLCGSENLSQIAVLDIAGLLFGFSVYMGMLGQTENGEKINAKSLFYSALRTPAFIGTVLGIAGTDGKRGKDQCKKPVLQCIANPCFYRNGSWNYCGTDTNDHPASEQSFWQLLSQCGEYSDNGHYADYSYCSWVQYGTCAGTYQSLPQNHIAESPFAGSDDCGSSHGSKIFGRRFQASEPGGYYIYVLACYIQYADFSEKEREQCLCIHNKFSVLCGLNPGLYHTGSGRMMELKEGIK